MDTPNALAVIADDISELRRRKTAIEASARTAVGEIDRLRRDRDSLTQMLVSSEAALLAGLTPSHMPDEIRERLTNCGEKLQAAEAAANPAAVASAVKMLDTIIGERMRESIEIRVADAQREYDEAKRALPADVERLKATLQRMEGTRGKTFNVLIQESKNLQRDYPDLAPLSIDVPPERAAGLLADGIRQYEAMLHRMSADMTPTRFSKAS